MGDDLTERARGLWEELAGSRLPDPGTADLPQEADPVEWAGEAELFELIGAVAPD